MTQQTQLLNALPKQEEAKSVYHKQVISHPEFYISKFSKDETAPYLVFIHGGPGFNCGTLEYLIEHEKLFRLLNYNIILYDQRKCGRSIKSPSFITHTNNVDDLQNICEHLINFEGINIKGLMGHSYGAKLLFDYYKKFKCPLPGIFISTANSLLTPRLNNLLLDFSYLKKENSPEYEEILLGLDTLDLEKLWELTEKLAPIFQNNKDRSLMYWANLSWHKKILKIQKEIKLPINSETFMQVRKDLYSKQENFSLDIQELTIPYLWINGFHDFIMNGPSALITNELKITLFLKSSHHPHIEENDRFCEAVNDFIKT